MSTMSLFCLFFAQKEWPDLIWISTRIEEIEETSLCMHIVQRVYMGRNHMAYWRSAGVQERLPVFCNSLS